jgi:hypothetical protein
MQDHVRTTIKLDDVAVRTTILLVVELVFFLKGRQSIFTALFLSLF